MAKDKMNLVIRKAQHDLEAKLKLLACHNPLVITFDGCVTISDHEGRVLVQGVSLADAADGGPVNHKDSGNAL